MRKMQPSEGSHCCGKAGYQRASYWTGPLDIVSSEYTNLDEGQMETEDQKWLMENSWKYGFTSSVIRWIKVTLQVLFFEPYNYRYVGKKAAKEITEQNLTLEEYSGKSL